MSGVLPEVLGILAALLVVAAIWETLRRGIVPERFAALWIIISILLIVLAVFPEIMTWLAKIVGVELPSNLLFFVSSFLLLLISVDFSYEIGKLDARTRRLAEEVALLQDDFTERPGGRIPKPDTGS